jgi:hypothetical protein
MYSPTRAYDPHFSYHPKPHYSILSRSILSNLFSVFISCLCLVILVSLIKNGIKAERNHSHIDAQHH